MIQVEIDYTINEGETAQTALENMAKGHAVLTEVLTDASTANGHPVALIKGQSDIVHTFLEAHGYDVGDYKIV